MCFLTYHLLKFNSFLLNLWSNILLQKNGKIYFIEHSQQHIRLVFSRFFYFRRNLGNVKEKSTRKTCYFPWNEASDFTRLPCKILLSNFSSISTKFPLYFHEKNILNGKEYVTSCKNESLSVAKWLN